MTRSRLQKTIHLDSTYLAAGARLRARGLALIHGCMKLAGVDQTTLATKLGVKKSAVNAVLRGSGNVRLDTLAEYLGALGFEADVMVVPFGEIDGARDSRRGPRHVIVTLADQDRVNSDTSEIDVIAIGPDRIRMAMNYAIAKHSAWGHDVSGQDNYASVYEAIRS